MSNPHAIVQVLRISDVIAITGLCRSSIYNKLNSKSPYYDQDFPKPFKLGLRSVGWLESDIKKWILEKSEYFSKTESLNENK